MKHVITSAVAAVVLSGCSLLNEDSAFPTNPTAEKSPVSTQYGVRDTHHHNIIKSFNRRKLVEPKAWARPPKPVEKSSYKPAPAIKVPSKVTTEAVKPKTLIASAKPCTESLANTSSLPCVPLTTPEVVLPSAAVSFSIETEPKINFVKVAKLSNIKGEN